MSTDERDPVVARALAALEVPDHGADFWARLDAAVGAADPPSAEAEVPAVAPARPDDGIGARPDDPVVVALASAVGARAARRAAPRRWLAAVAAVVALGGAAMGAQLLEGDDLPTTVPPASQPGVATTVAPPTTALGLAPEQDAVASFFDRLGGGDREGAAQLVGPRSKAYLEAGPGLHAILLESAEGWGSWAGSPDRRFTTVVLDAEHAVVVVQGTRAAEGTVEQAVHAVPVARHESGWVVELWAFDPATGGRLPPEVLPEPEADGVRVVAEGTEVVVPVAQPGSVWFAFLGGPAEEVVVGAGEPAARWTAPADAEDGGLLVAAFRNDPVFTAHVLAVRGA